MHYTGTIWRPPYEASSLLIEVTAGCTHHKCKFCTLYNDLPFNFRMSPLEAIEEDLLELKGGWYNQKADRVYLTGANPFILKFERLKEIANLIHKYLPQCQTIGCFARVTDIALKHGGADNLWMSLVKYFGSLKCTDFSTPGTRNPCKIKIIVFYFSIIQTVTLGYDFFWWIAFIHEFKNFAVTSFYSNGNTIIAKLM